MRNRLDDAPSSLDCIRIQDWIYTHPPCYNSDDLANEVQAHLYIWNCDILGGTQYLLDTISHIHTAIMDQ